ncbi:hypothetical protein [Natrinema pallidum]|uniref:Uncharacterized protein n=1 Tax=Natrinema pallidum TaxID=69527 RepID=A0A4P9TJY1_9EURY|nr:hypothetical protein [Natrinema pallidum]QCW05286.1 hypothetical protein FGF80_18770 [Natrinema pallidum]
MACEDSSEGTKRVLEIEIAADGDHTTHENTRTVFIVGDPDNLQDELLKAARMADMWWPDFLTEDGSAQLSGTNSLDDAEFRQFIDESQDDVLVGDEVPV